MPPRRATAPKQVKSTTHADKRTNIPTEELRDFVADDERNPIPVTYERPLLYPRDPDADPQLVWRGKDDQDTGPLTVPAVPLYIQEKIDPRALVEDLRRSGTSGRQKEQLLLFEDFDGLEGYEQVEFYEHAANWSNRMVLGDALLVMNSLAEKERLRGQVQMIYIDPPYGIKFGSNWQVSTRKRAVKDGTDASRQPEQVKAFRDTWRDDVHSYLTYLRDRLVISRDLLSDSGSLFMQIGDDNVHVVRSLLDEVFGQDNFCVEIAYQKTTGTGSPNEVPTILPAVFDRILWYAKDKTRVKYRQLYRDKVLGGDGVSLYTTVLLSDGTTRPLTAQEKETGAIPDGSRVFGVDNLTSSSGVDKTRYPVTVGERTYRPDPSVWKTDEAGMNRLLTAGRIYAGSGKNLGYIRFIDDFPASPLTNLWTDTVGQNQYGGPKMYVVQTALKAVQRCMLAATDPGDLVLDPTCGSGTTAVVAEQWGRRWITIDTSRVALALARTRTMSARFPYYLLADSRTPSMNAESLSGAEAS